jgi:hypothetical protein
MVCRSSSTSRRSLATFAAASCALVSSARAAPPVLEFHPVGLTGPGYTNAGGGHVSDIYAGNAAGQAVGTSDRLIEHGFYGRAAWFYDPASRRTTEIGLRGNGFVNSSGYVDIAPAFINTSGQVIGRSSAWDGETWLGWWSWLYDHRRQTTERIGLTDAPHTSSTGEQQGLVVAFDSTGRALGYSRRYNGTADAGMTAWLYRDGAAAGATTLGFADATHTRADGYRYSVPASLDPSGLVLGTSDRFNGTAGAGRTAWLYDPATDETLRLGFSGGEYRRGDGYESTTTREMRQSRFVIGNSSKFSSSTPLELFDGWVYDVAGKTYAHYGLTDAKHTGPGGARSSGVMVMNDRGDVAGVSMSFSLTSSTVGHTAWYQSGASRTPRAIGLTDAEHTNAAGVQNAAVRSISAAGHVVGTTVRGTAVNGRSAWLYDPQDDTTVRLGLYDAAHTHPFGWKVSDIADVNDRGQVIGWSESWVPSSPNRTAWFYDPATKAQTPLIFSVWPDGYESSSATYLGEDGVVLGTYAKSDGTTNHSSIRPSHAFYWSAADGFHDLGSLAAGGLDHARWQHLWKVLGRVGPHILGSVFEAGEADGTVAYLLSPKPGDSNYDGTVNFADLVALAQHYLAPGAHTFDQGDFTGDGRVDFADLVLLAQNYNQSLLAADAAPGLGAAFDADFTRAQAQAPEPGLAWGAIGTMVVGLRRRRRTKLQ